MVNKIKRSFFTDKKHVEFRILKEKIFKGTLLFLAFLVMIPLVIIIYDLVTKGYSQINFDFFVEAAPDTLQAIQARANNEIIPGGIANGIVGSIVIITIASFMAIPLGILVGTYLAEMSSHKLAGIVRFVVDMLQGVPSIVLGIIWYIWIIKPITKGFSGLGASVALAIMMLPSIIRTIEETLKMIPTTPKRGCIFTWCSLP